MHWLRKWALDSNPGFHHLSHDCWQIAEVLYLFPPSVPNRIVMRIKLLNRVELTIC